MANSGTEKASVLTYMDLLKRYGSPAHKTVQTYANKFAGDKVFLDRVSVINELFNADHEPAQPAPQGEPQKAAAGT
jgi:hypothetical protein